MPSIVFAVWTLFVWLTRIRNADGSIAAILLSLTFVIPAIAILVTKGRNGFWAISLAGWTVMVWFVRVIDIAFFSDHSGAFKAVHIGLGVVSFLLAGWVERSFSGGRAAAPAG